MSDGAIRHPLFPPNNLCEYWNNAFEYSLLVLVDRFIRPSSLLIRYCQKDIGDDSCRHSRRQRPTAREAREALRMQTYCELLMLQRCDVRDEHHAHGCIAALKELRCHREITGIPVTVNNCQMSNKQSNLKIRYKQPILTGAD